MQYNPISSSSTNCLHFLQGHVCYSWVDGQPTAPSSLFTTPCDRLHSVLDPLLVILFIFFGSASSYPIHLFLYNTSIRLPKIALEKKGTRRGGSRAGVQLNSRGHIYIRPLSSTVAKRKILKSVCQ